MKNRPGDRIVVTGFGVISPCGTGPAALWAAVRGGKSSAGPISGMDVSDLPSRIGCQVREFDPHDYLEPKRARHMDRATQMAVAAARTAVQDANLHLSDTHRAGLVLGSPATVSEWVFHQYDIYQERGINRVNPFTITAAFTGAAAGELAINLGFRGPVLTICTGSASGTDAIGNAMRIIQTGEADVMVTGGAEAPFVLPLFALFNRVGVLSKRNDQPAAACRPFETDRDGFVIGEGAGFLVLETEGHALRRGARIRGYAAGYGRSCDAFHMTSPRPDGEGAAEAMRLALADAGMSPSQVDYINAHGTATQLNDPVEARAIRAVFAARADEVMISSTKPITGHLQGSGGAVEAIIALLALKYQTAPPNINLDRPDPECRLNLVTPVARPGPINAVLSNSYGFGGRNSSLIFARSPS